MYSSPKTQQTYDSSSLLLSKEVFYEADDFFFSSSLLALNLLKSSKVPINTSILGPSTVTGTHTYKLKTICISVSWIKGFAILKAGGSL